MRYALFSLIILTGCTADPVLVTTEYWTSLFSADNITLAVNSRTKLDGDGCFANSGGYSNIAELDCYVTFPVQIDLQVYNAWDHTGWIEPWPCESGELSYGVWDDYGDGEFVFVDHALTVYSDVDNCTLVID